MEINEGIHDREVRVIDADGSQLGIMSTRDALAKAEEKNLDLVKIAPQAQPPVNQIPGLQEVPIRDARNATRRRRKPEDRRHQGDPRFLNIDTNGFNTKGSHRRRSFNQGR